MVGDAVVVAAATNLGLGYVPMVASCALDVTADAAAGSPSPLSLSLSLPHIYDVIISGLNYRRTELPQLAVLLARVVLQARARSGRTQPN